MRNGNYGEVWNGSTGCPQTAGKTAEGGVKKNERYTWKDQEQCDLLDEALLVLEAG